MPYFSVPYRVMYHDTMSLGWHHFMTSFKFQCQAREAFLFSRIVGGSERGESTLDDLWLVTRDAYSRMLGPVPVGRTVGILLTVEEQTWSSVRFCFRVVDSLGTPVACGYQTVVCVSAKTQGIIPHPPEMVRWGWTLREPMVLPSFAERARSTTRFNELFDDEVIEAGKKCALEQREAMLVEGAARDGTAIFLPRRELTVFACPGTGSFRPPLMEEMQANFPPAAALVAHAEAHARAILGAPAGPLFTDVGTTGSDSRWTESERKQLGAYLLAVLAGERARAGGARADIITGHSAGEIAALALGGAFSLEQGAEIICHRALALQAARNIGGLMAFTESLERVENLINVAGLNDAKVVIRNHGKQVIVAGRSSTLERLGQLAQTFNISATRLDSDYPFHSPLMAPAVALFESSLRKFSLKPPKTPVFSPIERRFYQNDDDLAHLLASHFVRPLVFDDALLELQGLGATTVIECGGGSALRSFVRATFPTERVKGLPAFAEINRPVTPPVISKPAAQQPLPLPAADAHPHLQMTTVVLKEEPGQAPATFQPGRTLVLCDNERLLHDAKMSGTLAHYQCTFLSPASRPVSGSMTINLSAGEAAQTDLAVLSPAQFDTVLLLCRAADQAPLADMQEWGPLVDLLFVVLRHCAARLESGQIRAGALCLGSMQTRDPQRQHPVTGLLAGAIKALANEMPGAVLKLLATDNQQINQQSLAWLEQEIAVGPGSAEVWRVQGRRCVRQLQLVDQPPAGEPFLNSKSVVVATGGAQGVTAVMVEVLLRRFGCTVVTLGRSDPSRIEPRVAAMSDEEFAAYEGDFYREQIARGIRPAEARSLYTRLRATRETARTLEQLRQTGGRVVHLALDLGDAVAVEQAIARIHREVGPVDMLVHGAGIQKSAKLANKTLEEFRSVIQVKIDGLAALQNALAKTQPNHPVHYHLVTSSFSHFGNPGQPDYGAANEAMNRMASWFDGESGNRWSALAWLGWDGVGMTRGSEYSALGKQRGIHPLTREEGAWVFDRLMAQTPAQPLNILITPAERELFKLDVAPAGGAKPQVRRQSGGSERHRMPIAVVSAGCVVPGSSSPEALWQQVMSKHVGISANPRYDRRYFVAEGPEVTPEKTYTPLGGFINDYMGEADDPGVAAWPTAAQRFFAGSLRQCLRVNPSKRLPQKTHFFLGATADGIAEYDEWLVAQVLQQWLAEAGHDPAQVRALIEQALQRKFDAFDPRFPWTAFDRVVHTMLGREHRLVMVDGACASSLVAIDAAVSALQAGTTDFAFAGGVFAAGPVNSCLFAQFSGLTRNASRPLDAAADGVVFSEGAALLGLKTLEAARRDGDKVLGILRGSACSSDGKSSSVMQPQNTGQKLAMRRAWQRAGLPVESAQMLEAHATATPVGDAVEVGAAAEVFANSREVELQSVKGLIGHTGWLAGAASLIKVLNALNHRTIPPQGAFERVNPNLHLEKTPFRISTQARPWPENADGQPRRAAINGFGFGGTNAHLIVDEDHDLQAVGAAAPAANRALPVVALADLDLPADWRSSPLHSLTLPPRTVVLPDVADQMDPAQFLAVALGHALLKQLDGLDDALKDETAIVCAFEGKTAGGITAAARIFFDQVNARMHDLAQTGAVDAAFAESCLDAIRRRVTELGSSRPYTLPGTMPNVITGRAANLLHLRGPNFIVDAGFNSFHEALVLGRQLLESGQCQVALIGALSVPARQLEPNRPDGAVGLALVSSELCATKGWKPVTWLSPDQITSVSGEPLTSARHFVEQLRAEMAPSNSTGAVTGFDISTLRQPFLLDHQVDSTPTVPGAFLMEMAARAACNAAAPSSCISLEDVNFARFLKIPEGVERAARGVVTRVDRQPQSAALEVEVQSDFVHASGRVLQPNIVHLSTRIRLGECPEDLRAHTAVTLAAARIADPYANPLSSVKLSGAFACIGTIQGDRLARRAEVTAPPLPGAGASVLPALLLDVMFRVAAAQVEAGAATELHVPRFCRRISVATGITSLDPGCRWIIQAGQQTVDGDTMTIDWAEILSPDGRCWVSAEGLVAHLARIQSPVNQVQPTRTFNSYV